MRRDERGRLGRDCDLRVGVSLRVGPYRSQHRGRCSRWGITPVGRHRPPKPGDISSPGTSGAERGTRAEKGRMLAGRLAHLGVGILVRGAERERVCRRTKGGKRNSALREHGLHPEKKRWKFPAVRKEETGCSGTGSHGI